MSNARKQEIRGKTDKLNTHSRSPSASLLRDATLIVKELLAGCLLSTRIEGFSDRISQGYDQVGDSTLPMVPILTIIRVVSGFVS